MDSTHQSGHWNFDPILTRAFMIRAVASCMSLTLTQWPCDPLPRPQFGFAEARSSYDKPDCAASPTPSIVPTARIPLRVGIWRSLSIRVIALMLTACSM